MKAYDYALLAQEAYSAKPDIGQAGSASRAIVRQTPAGLVIAFPGTDNLEGWLSDLNAMPVSVNGAGYVHSGFWEAWLAISNDVIAVVGDQPVTFVGHSLGAAVAIFAALDFTFAARKVAAVYGFEPPRVSPGMEVRSALAKVPLHLYCNGSDLVTAVPPGWQHAAMLIHIGKARLPFPNIEDHKIANVVSALS